MAVKFRDCTDSDVALLDRLNPSPSVESFHAQRFAAQRRGDGTYLLAWRRGVVVANALIVWRGCADESVRTAHPLCPEINGLEVFPAELRSRGIGSALIAACEQRASARGFTNIGLGVADQNQQAHRLYRRLGYDGETTYLDRYMCVDSMGTTHHFADPCRFLTKSLPQ